MGRILEALRGAAGHGTTGRPATTVLNQPHFTPPVTDTTADTVVSPRLGAALRLDESHHGSRHVPTLRASPSEYHDASASAEADESCAPEPWEPVAATTAGRVPQDASAIDLGDLTDGSALGRRYAALRDAISSQIGADEPAVVTLTAANSEISIALIAARLAVVCAQQRSGEVLLIDANLREVKVSQQFGVEGQLGLRDVLHGRARWQQAIRWTPWVSLHLLPAGTRDAANGHLTGPGNLRLLMRELRREFRLTIVAADAAEAGETAAWVRASSGVYLVVRAGRTDACAAQRALGCLHRAAGRVLGSIFADA